MSATTQENPQPVYRVMRGNRPWLAASLTVCALLASGCQAPSGAYSDSADWINGGGSDLEEAEYPAGPLHPDTLLVDDEPCIEDVLVAADRESISLSLNCPPRAFGLQPGRILLGSTDGGYLRRVESVQATGQDEVVLSTRFATLAEAFTDIQIAEHWTFGAREVIDFSGRTLQGEEGTSTHIEVATGSLGIIPELTVDVDFGFLSVKSVTAILKVGLNIDMEGVFRHEAGDENGGMIELQTIHHPLDVAAGPTRLKGELEMIVRVGYRNWADGPGMARTAMRGSGTVELGGTWEKPESWESHWLPNFEGEVMPLALHGEGAWEGELALQIEAKLKLQHVEGSTFRFEAYSGGSNSAGCDEKTWNSQGGLRGEAMMRLGFFDDGPRDEHMPDLAEELDPQAGLLTEAQLVCDTGDGGDDDTDDSPTSDDDDGDLAAGGESGGSVAPNCADANSISCGAMVSSDTSSLLATSLIAGYPDIVGNYAAAESIYQWTAPNSGPVEFRLVDPEPMVVDHDVIVLDAGGGACLGGSFVAYGFHNAAFHAVAGSTYLLIVDGYANDVGFFTAELDCSP